MTKPKTLDQRLAEFVKQPGAHISNAEHAFILAMRSAAADGVGYGWMQQVIEWEWLSKSRFAWGPEYFNERIAELQRERDEARAKLDATCSPESFNDLVRQRTELIAERDAMRAALQDCPDALAGKLIDVWCQDKGKQIPWAKAVQIIAIVTKQSDAERDRLLRMGDEDGSCEMCGRSDPDRSPLGEAT